ncbi:MAG: hypothetical protein M0Z89_12555 [Nitrospiraceae bacterium]|nr:hypothetical protein [Nitrospiraceae bacterium]
MSTAEIILAIGVTAFIIYAAFNIFYVMELRRTSFAVRQLVEKAGENIHPTLVALRRALEDIGTVTDNVAELSKSLREAADAVTAAEKRIKALYLAYEDGISEAARANIAGVQAGIKAGVGTLLKGLKSKEGGSL